MSRVYSNEEKMKWFLKFKKEFETKTRYEYDDQYFVIRGYTSNLGTSASVMAGKRIVELFNIALDLFDDKARMKKMQEYLKMPLSKNIRKHPNQIISDAYDLLHQRIMQFVDTNIQAVSEQLTKSEKERIEQQLNAPAPKAAHAPKAKPAPKATAAIKAPVEPKTAEPKPAPKAAEQTAEPAKGEQESKAANGDKMAIITEKLKMLTEFMKEFSYKTTYSADDKYFVLDAVKTHPSTYSSLKLTHTAGEKLTDFFVAMFDALDRKEIDKRLKEMTIPYLGAQRAGDYMSPEMAVNMMYDSLHDRFMRYFGSLEKQLEAARKAEEKTYDKEQFDSANFANPGATDTLKELNERVMAIRTKANKQILDTMVQNFNALYDGELLTDDRFGDIVKMISQTLDLCEGKKLEQATKVVAFNIDKMESVVALLREFNNIEKDVVASEITSSAKSVDEVLASLREEGLTKEKLITECIYSIDRQGGFLNDTQSINKNFAKIPSRIRNVVKTLKKYFEGSDEKEILSIFKKTATGISQIESDSLAQMCDTMEEQFESVLTSKPIQQFIRENASQFTDLKILHRQYHSTKNDLPRQLLKLLIKSKPSITRLNSSKIRDMINFVGVEDKPNLMYELLTGDYSILGRDLDDIKLRQIPSIRKAIQGANLSMLEKRFRTTEMLKSNNNALRSYIENKELFIKYGKDEPIDYIAKDRAKNVAILKSVYDSATVANMIMANYAILDVKPHILTYMLNFAAQENPYGFTRKSFALAASTILFRKRNRTSDKTRSTLMKQERDAVVKNNEPLKVERELSKEEQQLLDKIFYTIPETQEEEKKEPARDKKEVKTHGKKAAKDKQADLPQPENVAESDSGEKSVDEKIEHIKSSMLKMMASEKNMQALDSFAQNLNDEEKVRLYLFAVFEELYQFSQFDDKEAKGKEYLQETISDFAPVLYSEVTAFSEQVEDFEGFFTSTRQWLLEKCNSSLEESNSSYEALVATQDARYDPVIGSAMSDSERDELLSMKNTVISMLKTENDKHNDAAMTIIDMTTEAEAGKRFFEDQLEKTSEILAQELKKEAKKQYEEAFGKTEDKKPLSLTDEEWTEFQDLDEQVSTLKKYVRGKDDRDDMSK